MTRFEFEQLSKPEQVKLIGEHGVFLADKVEAGISRFTLVLFFS